MLISCRENGLEYKIKLIKGRMEEVELPMSKVSFLFYVDLLGPLLTRVSLYPVTSRERHVPTYQPHTVCVELIGQQAYHRVSLALRRVHTLGLSGHVTAVM